MNDVSSTSCSEDLAEEDLDEAIFLGSKQREASGLALLAGLFAELSLGAKSSDAGTSAQCIDQLHEVDVDSTECLVLSVESMISSVPFFIPSCTW